MRSEISKVYHDWNVASIIAKGSGGVVFLVEKDQERRAVKVMKTSGTFASESSVSKLLNNKPAVPFLGVPRMVHCNQQYALFESEYCKNRSLGDAFSKNIRFSLADVKTIAFQLATALSSLESVGVLHFDVKPDNILVTSTSPLSIKLIDFDRCVIVSDCPTLVNSRMGSGKFMSPELLNTLETNISIPAASSMTVWSYGITILDAATRFMKRITELNELIAFVDRIGAGPVVDVVADVAKMEGLNEFLSFIIKTEPEMRPPFQKIIRHEWLESVSRGIDENRVRTDNQINRETTQFIPCVDNHTNSVSLCK